MADSNHFFMAMVPPTATKQEAKVRVGRDGKPHWHPSQAWADAESKLRAHLERHRPDERASGAVVLDVTWCFPSNGHEDGEPYIKKPDTDNLQKGLKDVMTDLGWWEDDALVFSERATKVYGDIPGIRIDIEKLGD